MAGVLIFRFTCSDFDLLMARIALVYLTIDILDCHSQEVAVYYLGKTELR